MLEVVQTITEPLLAKLRFHFASGRPTDRIDQPDWLFDTAAKATQENLEAFKVLQPAVEQHGLERVFYLPFEFARAMHAAVQTVLKERVLPRLAQQVHNNNNNNNNSNNNSNNNNNNLQAFQLIVLARYLLGVPKPSPLSQHALT